MIYHEVRGFVEVSQWKRAASNRNLDKIATLMEDELNAATAAMRDGVPLEISQYLAFQYMPRLYEHQMDYALTLLRSGDVARFNTLREATSFLTLNLAHRDLSGLNLRGANFAGAELTASDFTGCDLSDADFWRAEMPRANLSETQVNRTNFSKAVLSSAVMVGIRGEQANFEEAVLVDASVVRLERLTLANFAGAELAQANLFGSKFPSARFDRADFTLASAVGSDFGDVESMRDVNLTGTNLTGARLEPGKVERAWFVNADGLQEELKDALRRSGGVASPEEVLQRVDSRIVAGFQAQIEEDPAIRPDQRRAVLLQMLQEYYLN
jgi:uncharacterized protein YjbI with pentapeptide repeats